MMNRINKSSKLLRGMLDAWLEGLDLLGLRGHTEQPLNRSMP